MKLTNYVSRMRRRTLVISGALILLIAAGSVYWFGFAMPASSSQAAQAPVTRTVQASLQTMEKSVSTTGTLTPTVQQTAGFTVSGTVTAVNVVAGQTVTAGQALATVDTMTVDAALLQAKATLATAEAKLADATSASDGSDAAVAQIAADQSSVDLASAAVTDAETDVTDATLTAPVAGLVTTVGVAVGDRVSAGSSSGSSTSSSSGAGTTGAGSTAGTSAATSGTTTTASTSGFTIVSTDSWQVSVAVSESDIANVAKDDQVELSLTGGTAFFGTVASVGLLPSATSGAVTYPVVVSVTGSPAGLYDGVSVTTAIVYERRTNVLTVPSEAVTTAAGTSTVTTLDAEGAEVKTPVVVGETVGTLTEITSGLAEGDSVVVTVFTPGGTGTGGQTGGTGTGRQTGEFPGGGTGTFPGGGTGTIPGGAGGGTGGTTTGTTRSTTRNGGANG
ncbi:hypothetical protein B7R21_13195 [Subtercola boreus]|uniref:Uncharacterized protein n=1 Tax=Subtercola boreus TaxID=120213 RepID=A0A3E0VP75_9MICO|nr:biotin/lipoyl-binding protein [Subtercola boreus]RFA11409.1 hypothetical protein B7R21_13195 [Subtercola boreus]